MSLFLMVPSPGRAASPLDSVFWQQDKREHYVLTGLVTGSTYLLLRKMSYGRWESLATSVAVGVLVGTAKEIRDRSVDPDDIKADTFGAVMVGGLFFSIDLAAF